MTQGRGCGDCYHKSFVFSVAPRHATSTLRQVSQNGLRPYPEKKSEHWTYGPVLSSSSQEEGGSWEFSPHHIALFFARVVIMERGYLKFSYWHPCDWFYAHQRCRRLSNSFWVSQKGNQSVYCWFGVSVGERRVQGWYSAILLMSLLLNLFRRQVITARVYE